MKASMPEVFVIIAGVVALLLLRMAPQQAQGAATVEDMDVWQTPFYLRYNVPILTDSRPILPRSPNPNTFALGVAAQPIEVSHWGY
jgi:hypothetical protein